MSKGNVKVQHSMQGVFIFVLLGLFALMSTLMVLLGAQMYRGTVEKSTDNNEYRVLSAYVRSMVRAEDARGSVSVAQYGDIAAVAMRETIDDEAYVTWIYGYDGDLYEQFTDASYEFDPEEGTPICPAGSFEPSLDDGLLTVRMTDGNGEPCTVQVALKCD